MASVIAKLESGIDRDPSSFDVLDLLDKYASHDISADDDDQESPIDLSRPSKRRREETDLPAPSTGVNRGQGSFGYAPTATPNNPAPFELQPAPGFTDTATQNSSQAQQAMMQLMNFVNSRNANVAVDLNPSIEPNLTTSAPAMDTSTRMDPGLSEDNAFSSMPGMFNDISQLNFMDLVDWDSSLANLQGAPSFAYQNPANYADGMVVDDQTSDGADSGGLSNDWI